MRQLYVIGLIVLFAFTSNPVRAKAKTTDDEKTKQLLIQIERNLGQASLNLDPAPYERYWADDFVAIMNEGLNPNAKAEHRAALTGGKIKFESFEIENFDVRVFGNAAIVMSHRKVKFRFEEREINLNNVVTSFFSKRNGRWQKVAEQTVHL